MTSQAITHLLDLLQQPGAYAPGYDKQISEVLALLDGTYVSAQGLPAHAAPGEGADVQVWILGASGGSSAAVAGAKGLRFVASYHHSPSTVIDAVEAYRAAFQPSEMSRNRTWQCRWMRWPPKPMTRQPNWPVATLPGSRRHPPRRGRNPVPFPAEATSFEWTDDDRELVRDRVLTQFVGSAGVRRRQTRSAPRCHRRRRDLDHDHHPRPRGTGAHIRTHLERMERQMTAQTTPDTGVLDNAMWESMTGAHRHLSEGTTRARRYLPTRPRHLWASVT